MAQLIRMLNSALEVEATLKPVRFQYRSCLKLHIRQCWEAARLQWSPSNDNQNVCSKCAAQCTLVLCRVVCAWMHGTAQQCVVASCNRNSHGGGRCVTWSDQQTDSLT